MTTVSIVTPTFNRARFLPDAVASVLAQTYQDFELIIVDDGSTDDTKAVLEPFLSDARIRYHFQPNQGQSRARNHALSMAKGQFVAFLDSDDLWDSAKLSNQVRILTERDSVDVVHGDERTIDECGAVISEKNMRRYSGSIARYLLADNSVSITTALVRKRCFDEMGGFDESVGVADDYDLWLRFSARYCFHYEPEIVASYRVMSDQISSDKKRRFAANEAIITRFLEHYGECLSDEDRRWGVSRFYCRKARYLAGSGNRGRALGALLQAMKRAPLDSAVWRAGYRVLVPSP